MGISGIKILKQIHNWTHKQINKQIQNFTPNGRFTDRFTNGIAGSCFHEAVLGDALLPGALLHDALLAYAILRKTLLYEPIMHCGRQYSMRHYCLKHQCLRRWFLLKVPSVQYLKTYEFLRFQKPTNYKKRRAFEQVQPPSNSDFREKVTNRERTYPPEALNTISTWAYS